MLASVACGSAEVVKSERRFTSVVVIDKSNRCCVQIEGMTLGGRV